MALCSVGGCENQKLAKGLCNGHYKVNQKYGDPYHPVRQARQKGEGSYTNGGYHFRRVGGEFKYEHIKIAESALGRPLPKGAIVHHVDGDPSNNDTSNLVICQDQQYHLMLHTRQRALEACGNPNYRKCMNCGQWDDVSRLKWHKSTTYYHKPASICKGA